MMQVPTPDIPEDPGVRGVIFDSPDLSTYFRLDDLGLVVEGQHLAPERTILLCRAVQQDRDRFCRQCGAEGQVQDRAAPGAHPAGLAPHDAVPAPSPLRMQRL